MNVFGIFLALIPVLLFLAGLFFLDSYKLVSMNKIFQCLLAGLIAAVLVYFINTYLMKNVFTDRVLFSRYGAPFVEEALKLIFPLWLAFRKKVGFMVDGAILGFAAGAGFSLIENVFFLFSLSGNTNLLLWAIRGLGTAVMHGSTTAIAMIILMSGFSKRSVNRLFIAWLSAVFIHSLFNHFLISPLMMTLLQIIILPILVLTVFEISEKGLKSWLDTGFDSDVSLLNDIQKGQIRSTPQGKYLMELKNRFPGEAMVDMLCYIRIQLELAVSAKGMLLMREAGFSPQPPTGTQEKFAELRMLESLLGPVGILAIKPLMHDSIRDLWQLHYLGEASRKKTG